MDGTREMSVSGGLVVCGGRTRGGSQSLFTYHLLPSSGGRAVTCRRPCFESAIIVIFCGLGLRWSLVELRTTCTTDTFEIRAALALRACGSIFRRVFLLLFAPGRGVFAPRLWVRLRAPRDMPFWKLRFIACTAR